MLQIVDLKTHYNSLKEEIEKAVLEVLASGHYIMGKNVLAFEEELASYVGSKYAIACANGTDALTLSLMALGIKPGDEIITVSHSFFATSEAISLVGAIPKFVDINEEDFNIDPSKIESLITKKTKGIIPVHLYGQPCEIEKVSEIAKKHGLFVIEDCAQALGAKFNGKSVGTFGIAGTISFFPTKNLGACGDAGAIVTNDEQLSLKLKQLRLHGSSKRYVHDHVGLNSRLDEIQACVLRIGLKNLDKWNNLRQNAAKYYNELLSDREAIIMPKVKNHVNHIFHQYTIRLKNRDFICEKLREEGIEALIYYPIPIHLQKALSHLNNKPGSLPITETICNEILSLPMYPEITKEIQEKVIDSLKKYS